MEIVSALKRKTCVLENREEECWHKEKRARVEEEQKEMVARRVRLERVRRDK